MNFGAIERRYGARSQLPIEALFMGAPNENASRFRCLRNRSCSPEIFAGTEQTYQRRRKN
jgi:hypothetical protein